MPHRRQYAPLLWCTALLVVVVHEGGHALAALVENLSVDGGGVFFSFILPGAYVRIEDGLRFLSPPRQVRALLSLLSLPFLALSHNLISPIVSRCCTVVARVFGRCVA
jgi:hypothetical protein